MEDLQGKAALITGSTSGIGAAAARTLARYGVQVAVTGRNAELGEQVVADIRSSGGQAAFIRADLSDPAAPALLVREAAERWGRLDIVVNNAALTCNKPIEATTNADWDALFQVNVKAAFFTVQAALPWLERRGGVVLNVSSINRWINDKNNFVYDTMKAALNHLTRGLALDLLDKGIRVNAIMPGGTYTPMLTNWLEQKLPEAEAKAAAEQLRQDRFVAAPQTIADAIVALCSDRCAWINGAEIPADGGRFLLP